MLNAIDGLGTELHKSLTGPVQPIHPRVDDHIQNGIQNPNVRVQLVHVSPRI